MRMFSKATLAKLLSSLGVVILAVEFTSHSASAAIINGTISGTVTSTQGNVPGVMAGSPVAGTYSYDDAIFVASGSALIGGGNPLTSFTLSIGTNPKTFTLADLTTVTFSDPLRLLGTPAASTGALLFAFTIPAGSDFFQTQIPSSPGGFSGITDFSSIPQSANIAFPSFSSTNPSVQFSFTATPVPEPITIAGSSLALAGLAFFKYQQQKMRKTSC
jgi:hypothetical protein